MSFRITVRQENGGALVDVFVDSFNVQVGIDVLRLEARPRREPVSPATTSIARRKRGRPRKLKP